MQHDSELKALAEAGAAIQRSTRFGASRNKKLKAFNTAFNQYITGIRYQRAREEIIAAMADDLENQLDRDRLFARGQGPLRKRCEHFASLFMGLMEGQSGDQPVDTNFLRFARAAYGFLLMEVYDQLQEGKIPLARQLDDEAGQLGLTVPEYETEDED